MQSASQRLSRAWTGRGALVRALWPLSVVFRVLVAARKSLYRTGVLRAPSLPIPVVVVGNLVAGGAGKTPAVAAVVELLRARGWHPGIVSRGYGRREDDVAEVTPQGTAADSGDEPLLLRLRTGVPVVVGRDRVAAAKTLHRLHPKVDVVVSDDGLQHLRLVRCAQVLVFDERGAGNGWLLPAGPLREPMTARPPERSVVLYNAPRASTAWPGHVAGRRLAGAVALADWWDGRAASPAQLQALGGRPMVAAAGTASPDRFFAMLAEAGLGVTELALPDHFDFASLPWPRDTADVIVTEKDAVKLRPERLGSTRVWVAPLDFRLGADFERDLLALLPSPDARNLHGQSTA